MKLAMSRQNYFPFGKCYCLHHLALVNLIIETVTVSETLEIHSILTWSNAQYFTEFTHHQNFKSYRE
jgi:hypothetical protein